MSPVNTISRLVTYDRLAFENFRKELERRGWKEAVKDRGIAHGSFKNTMVHILNVHEWLLVGAAQGKTEVWRDPEQAQEKVRSLAQLRRYRSRVWGEIDSLMAGLTESRLRRRVEVPWLLGKYALEDVFFQASFEQAHHLGEIIGAYWQMNMAPPQMMWIPTLMKKRVSVR